MSAKSSRVMSKITENTLVPISLVIMLVGGIVWLSDIHAKAAYAESKLTKLEQALIDIAEMKKDIHYIKENVQRKR
jgi:hypothetical protein